jgi:hypothetical protein
MCVCVCVCVCVCGCVGAFVRVCVWVWGVGAHLKRSVRLGDSYLIRYNMVCIAFELSRVVCAEGIQEQQNLIKSTRVGLVGV